MSDGREERAENSSVCGAGAERLPEPLSLQVPSAGLHFLLIKLPRKMFPWLNSSGNRGLFGFRRSPCPVFFAQPAAPFGSSRLKFPGLFLSFILPLAWKNSSDPPCRVEQKGQIFLQAGALYQEASPAGQPSPPVSRPALERVLFWEGGMWKMVFHWRRQIGGCLSKPHNPSPGGSPVLVQEACFNHRTH